MKIKEARRLAEQLRGEILRHNDLYYKESAPLISDFEYDLLLHKLETLEKLFPELETPDSPTKKVGSDALKEFSQYSHDYPMLSLANTYSESELTEFDARVRKAAEGDFQYVCELKFDGASISLNYSKGRLIRALTRGDGEKGDDVTANIMTIGTVPKIITGKSIPEKFTIRGEIIIHKSDFIRLNENRISTNEQPFANPRNAASGTLKLLDSKTVATRPLNCYLYNVLSDQLPYSDHFNNMSLAKSWGFNISDSMKLCSDIEEVFKYINYWESKRKEIDYEIDGIVIKVNGYALQESLGFTSRTPRWAVAYKYKSEQALTQLLSVSFQVGRTGTVTPVANLSPVLLAGTTVKRATLHNADQILMLDLHTDDMVFIEKGGEIIPKIVGVDVSKRNLLSNPVIFPDKCPECGETLTRAEGESAWVCPNEKLCPPQIKGRIEHFIGRKAMNIDGIGEETVDLLYSAKLINCPADLYDLDKEQLAGLAGLGEKSAANIVESLNRSKEVPWHKVLFALGIRHVGEATSRSITERFRNSTDLINATFEELTIIPDVGPRIASSIRAYFDDPDNLEGIDRLKKNGIRMFADEKSDAQEAGILEGKVIVISGIFELHDRDEYKEMIISLGGKNSSSVSSKTSFLLAGANPGPSKLEAAESLGVKILDEGEFLKLIGN